MFACFGVVRLVGGFAFVCLLASCASLVVLLSLFNSNPLIRQFPRDKSISEGPHMFIMRASIIHD